MKTSVRIVAAVSTLILAASLAAATAVTSQSSTGPTQRVSDCAGKQLQVRLGRLGAAAGSRYQTIRFTNTGAHRCRFHGHPRVSFRGRHGFRIGWPAERIGGSGDTFALRPGRTARAVLQIPDWHNFPRRDCQAKGSPRLRVVPPSTRRKVGFRYPIKTCTTRQGRSTIRPVRLAR